MSEQKQQAIELEETQLILGVVCLAHNQFSAPSLGQMDRLPTSSQTRRVNCPPRCWWLSAKQTFSQRETRSEPSNQFAKAFTFSRQCTIVRTKEAQLATSCRLPNRPPKDGCYHWGEFNAQKRCMSLPKPPAPVVAAQDDFQLCQRNVAGRCRQEAFISFERP